MGKQRDTWAPTQLVLWWIRQQRCHARKARKGKLKQWTSCHVEPGPGLRCCGEHLESWQAVRQAWKLSGNARSTWSRVCCGNGEDVMGWRAHVHVQR